MRGAPVSASTKLSWGDCGADADFLAAADMPLDVPPPRTSRFGSPLVLSRVHWVRPELVAEVKFLTWPDENLLRQVVYEGLREDKPAADVRRPVPHLKAEPPKSTPVPSKRQRSKRRRAHQCRRTAGSCRTVRSRSSPRDVDDRLHLRRPVGAVHRAAFETLGGGLQKSQNPGITGMNNICILTSRTPGMFSAAMRRASISADGMSSSSQKWTTPPVT